MKPTSMVFYKFFASGVDSGGSAATFSSMTFGQWVKSRREAKGLTQAELGAGAGVDGQSISNVETGKTQSLKTSNMRRLAEALGLTFEAMGQEVRDAGATMPGSPVSSVDADSTVNVKMPRSAVETIRGILEKLPEGKRKDLLPLFTDLPENARSAAKTSNFERAKKDEVIRRKRKGG